MHSFYDYKKFAILYVDDEEKSLKYFAKAFGEHFRIFTAPNAEEGFKILDQNKDDIAILMTDQRMPGEKGVQLLEKARQLRPRVIRILATAFSDLSAAIDAVNSGAIYKYVSKPWDIPQLEATLRRGMEFFMVQKERDQLMREKLSVLHNIMIADRIVSLGILAAGLGHHVRNSLVAVRTFIDLAPAKLEEENVDMEELRNPNYWQEFYGHVQHQLKRITEMLTDLGAASSDAGSLFRDRVEIKQFILRSAEKVRPKLEEKKIVLRTEIPEGLPSMMVDGIKFQRLFDLLFADEVISLPNGSELLVKVSMVTPPPLNEPNLLIEIHDNGPGLPEKSLRSVFDPFFIRSDNPQDFGINLMTCYFLVYHHGGKIEVKSGAEQGTTFLVTLPLNPLGGPSQKPGEDFIAKAFVNETLWEKLLAGS